MPQVLFSPPHFLFRGPNEPERKLRDPWTMAVLKGTAQTTLNDVISEKQGILPFYLPDTGLSKVESLRLNCSPEVRRKPGGGRQPC